MTLQIETRRVMARALYWRARPLHKMGRSIPMDGAAATVLIQRRLAGRATGSLEQADGGHARGFQRQGTSNGKVLAAALARFLLCSVHQDGRADWVVT